MENKMNKAEIAEGNKLIAEFMKRQMYIDNPTVISWEWLMPVVEEIERNGCIITMWLSNAKGCKIYQVKQKIEFAHESMDITVSTWLAVVEFIKWFNSNK